MRFVKTKRFSPVIFEKDLPDKEDYFHLSADSITKEYLLAGNYIIDDDWWHIQRDRCIYGYDVPNAIEKGGDEYRDGIEAIWTGNDCYIPDLQLTIKDRTVHISGKMYFYLNFWKINRVDPVTKRKEYGNPRFSTLSFENWTIIELMRLLEKDLMICKTRQRGLSEESACDVAYEYLFYPNSQSVIVAGLDTYAETTMNMTLRGMEQLKNTQFYEIAKPGHDRQEYIQSKYKGSKIYRKTAKGNEQAVSSLSPSNVKLEETGTWESGLVKKVSSYLDPSMRANEVKTGFKVFVGCVCKGTKIYTNIGELKNIEDLKQEEGILGYDNIGISKETISHFNPPAQKPCYRIETRYGTILECSEDHPILWSKFGYSYNERKYINGRREYTNIYPKVKFKEAKEIKVGEQVMMIDSVPIFGNLKMWYPRMVGMLIGDGSYGFDKTPVFSNCDIELNSYVERNFNYATEEERITKDGRVYKETRIKDICCELRKLNIYGQTKENKRLPANMHMYDKDSICELIAGLYDTDGCVTRSNMFENKSYVISISQLSKELLIELKYLLLKLGIHSNLFKHKHNIRDRKIRDIKDLWVLQVSNKDSLLRFSENIKLFIKYKQNVLEEIKENTTKLQRKEQYVSTEGKIGCKSKLTFCSKLRPETVISIEYIGYKDVYNLTASNTNTYVANGIVTHNTGGKAVSGVEDMKDMFYHPAKFNLLEFDNVYEESDTKIARFIPAWKFKIIDEDGNSLREESIKSIREERLKLAPADRYEKTILEPLIPSELFMIPSGGFFGQHISQWCNERIAYIDNNKASQVVKRYKGEWLDSNDYDKGVKFEYDPEGPFMISEFPEEYKNKDGGKGIYENLYRAGTDSYDQDEAKTSNSKGSCWIKKGFLDANHTSNKFVATVFERPTTEEGGSDLFYEHTAMLCVAYNAMNLIEHSKILIINWYEKHRLLHRLKLRPTIIVSNWVDNSKSQNKYGIDPATKPFWLKLMRDKLNNKLFIDECDHPLLLDAWSKFRYSPSEARYNCDNTIASSLCIVSEEDEIETMVQSSETQTEKRVHSCYKRIDGRLVNIMNVNQYAGFN